jgi:hypothetical protein
MRQSSRFPRHLLRLLFVILVAGLVVLLAPVVIAFSSSTTTSTTATTSRHDHRAGGCFLLPSSSSFHSISSRSKHAYFYTPSLVHRHQQRDLLTLATGSSEESRELIHDEDHENQNSSVESTLPTLQSMSLSSPAPPPAPAAAEKPVPCPDCDLCDGSGRIAGGIGAILSWIPIKAYRPCPNFVARGGTYQRAGQGLDEIAFGRDVFFKQK